MVTFNSYTLLRRLEGCRLTAYPDEGGVWTIGYGHTGPEVVPGLVWTLAQAEDALHDDATKVVGEVWRLVDEPLTQHQLDALTIFAYNVGLQAFEGSTLLRKLNEGRYGEVPYELRRWTKVHDSKTGRMFISSGLVARRAAEVALWNGETEEGAV